MNGIELRRILGQANIGIQKLAEKMDMSQSNLSKQFKVQDVKTGILERICEVLNVSMDFFYGGTKYMTGGGKDDNFAINANVGVVQEEDVATRYAERQKKLADEKDQEIIFLRGQVQALKETIQMLGGKNPVMESSMPLQKKNA